MSLSLIVDCPEEYWVQTGTNQEGENGLLFVCGKGPLGDSG